MFTANGWINYFTEYPMSNYLSIPAHKAEILNGFYKDFCLFHYPFFCCLTWTVWPSLCVPWKLFFHSPLLNYLQFPKTVGFNESCASKIWQIQQPVTVKYANQVTGQLLSIIKTWPWVSLCQVKVWHDGHDGDCRFERKAICLKIKQCDALLWRERNKDRKFDVRQDIDRQSSK